MGCGRAEVLDLRHGLQFVGGGRVNGGDDVAGRDGVLGRLDPPLDDAERAGLRASATALSEVIDAVV